jgi:hypothetical protein
MFIPVFSFGEVATVALGFGYSALVAPAPLLTLVGVGAAYWANKLWLLRAASSGWIRGAGADAQTRVRALNSRTHRVLVFSGLY